MNPRVTKVTPEDNYCLLLEFSNGERREFDVSPYLEKGIFTQLKEATSSRYGFLWGRLNGPRVRIFARIPFLRIPKSLPEPEAHPDAGINSESLRSST
jgi:hypothetical protein